MHVHVLGVCGTFMGGLALLARAAGHRVTGSDENVYPPMSTLLAEQGVEVREGYAPDHLDPVPDMVVVGNVMTRGRPVIEYLLDTGLPYTSGPQWLGEHVLRGRRVLAVAGTHGKTTTTSMLAWILDHAGLSPGFLVGGVPANFGVSARLGDGPFFVVEADEYDTAFFDKRSKFVHYRPRTLILNNLEYDHADIFPDLASIQRQFHHLVRTVAGSGLIIANGADAHVAAVLEMGCWTPVERFGLGTGGWEARLLAPDGSRFEVSIEGRMVGELGWDLLGVHNVENALAAIAAARHAGVPPEAAIAALAEFRNTKRRLELRGTVDGIAVYDDFAHHPTAIRLTLEGLRARVGRDRVIALLEPRSNTMRMGVHKTQLAGALDGADLVMLYEPPDLGWPLTDVADSLGPKASVASSVDDLVSRLLPQLRSGDHVVIMSNGAFGGIHDKLLTALGAREAGR